MIYKKDLQRKIQLLESEILEMRRKLDIRLGNGNTILNKINLLEEYLDIELDEGKYDLLITNPKYVKKPKTKKK